MKLTLLVLRMVPPIKLGLFVVGGERYLVSFAFCEALGKKKKKAALWDNNKMVRAGPWIARL